MSTQLGRDGIGSREKFPEGGVTSQGECFSRLKSRGEGKEKLLRKNSASGGVKHERKKTPGNRP